MTVTGTSKVYKHPKAGTLYLTIPSKLATDSNFPFKKGDRVIIKISVLYPRKRIIVERKD